MTALLKDLASSLFEAGESEADIRSSSSVRGPIFHWWMSKGDVQINRGKPGATLVVALKPLPRLSSCNGF